MKKNDWILISTVALYSFLFYQQTAGVNFVIFTAALIISLWIKDKRYLKSNKWCFAAAGSLLTSLCIAYYGTTLAVIANIISLSLLSIFSYSNKTSVIAGLLFSFYSYFSSVFFIFMDWQDRKMAEVEQRSTVLGKRLALIGIPLLITLLFFFMYRAANPLFYDFTKNINLDFISWSWITFTLGGVLLLYGFFYPNKIKLLSDLDENAVNDLNPNDVRTITLFGKKLSVNDEQFSGTVLFLLLNFLLLLVNGLDINFLFNGRKLPQGVTYSQFVHQGTGMLITSILIAIAIILFYFRGALNFSEKSRTIKLLACLWILQNILILISTSLRNNMYITEYGLTYKRIGVYVYLILTLIGLLTTYVKILKAKSNNYLFRINGWAFYAVLVVSCFTNWDKFISEFNIHKAKKLENNYLLTLSYANLPQLFMLQQDSSKRSLFYLEKEEQDNEVQQQLDSYEPTDFETQLSKKLYSFLNEHKNLSWKSWYYQNKQIYNELRNLNDAKKITILKLPSAEISSLSALSAFNQITTLDLSYNNISDINELQYFNALKKVNLKGNKLVALKGIELLPNIADLNISNNPIRNYIPLYTLKNLKRLHVGNNITQLQYEALQKNLPLTQISKE